MAFTLKRLGIRSIPLNILTPIQGTPLAHAPQLPPLEILRAFAVFRFILPQALIRTAGGNITLSCRRDGDNVYYSVSDTGIGIPEKDIDRVFERFYRVEQSRAKETGGSGLGLSIAQYIAKGNNAELSLKSKLNEGTTISVIFPVKKEEEEMAEE